MKRLKEEMKMSITFITKRLVLPALVIVLGLSSCKKDIQSVNWNNNGTTTNNGSTIGLTDDEKLRRVTIDIPAQVVKTSVSGNTLTMIYTQDISALLNPNGYDLSYSIRLNQDFSAAALNNFSYTTPAPNGSYTTDWAGNDLKVLNEVIKTDVVVDGKALVKLHLLRKFTFVKNYGTAQEAVNQQNALINNKNDVVKFTGYVVFGKDYPSTTATAKLVYTK